MDRVMLVILPAIVLASLIQISAINAEETVLSAILTPDDKDRSLRQQRSYHERYGTGRFNDRQDYDRPSRCGRCIEDRYSDRDDYDRGRDRYDDDRRPNRPTYGNRQDKNKNYADGDDDRRYNDDRKNGPKNGTEDENDNDKKKHHDDRDSDRDRDRPSGGRRDRDRDRNRYDDRDRYSPDYYDRFLRDPHRDRYDRPYYDDPYRERRPYYDRYPDRYDEGYGGRYDGYGYPGQRRPYNDDRYDTGNGYDDYGGYGPGVGRGPHDSFRPWDETYRGQAGWDAGGRGYYFASGRPDATSWGRPDYSSLSRPEPTASGWQNVGSGYSGSSYREPVDYRNSYGYDTGYRQDVGYGQASGWHNVGGRRPYRDQSGVSQVDKGIYPQPSRTPDNRLQHTDSRQQNTDSRYQNNRQNYAQAYQPAQSSTTPATSYLYQREDEQVTKTDETTKTPT